MLPMLLAKPKWPILAIGMFPASWIVGFHVLIGQTAIDESTSQSTFGRPGFLARHFLLDVEWKYKRDSESEKGL